MAESQLYSSAFVTIDSSILSEASSVSVSRKSGASNVLTLAKGFAGVSPGANMIEVKVTNAVPAVGFEIDFSKMIGNLVPVEIGIFAAGKQLISKGFITEDDLKKAVNGDATLDITFVGAYANWT